MAILEKPRRRQNYPQKRLRLRRWLVCRPPPAANVETQSSASRFRARRNSPDDAFRESEIGARKVSGARTPGAHQIDPAIHNCTHKQYYLGPALWRALEFISPGWRAGWGRGLEGCDATRRSRSVEVLAPKVAASAPGRRIHFNARTVIFQIFP